jgi:hypothetical protein
LPPQAQVIEFRGIASHDKGIPGDFPQLHIVIERRHENTGGSD